MKLWVIGVLALGAASVARSPAALPDPTASSLLDANAPTEKPRQVTVVPVVSNDTEPNAETGAGRGTRAQLSATGAAEAPVSTVFSAFDRTTRPRETSAADWRDLQNIGESGMVPPPPANVPFDIVHPLAAMSDEEVAALVVKDLPALGSMSIGAPNRGALINGVPLPTGEAWQQVDPKHAWATAETVAFLEYAVSRFLEEFPDSPRLYVGDLSAPKGGRLQPHESHQSGRDVDLGYFYVGKPTWYRTATSRNLDCARTWALLKVLLTETPVEYVFVDRRVQSLLRAYALRAGEDRAWIDRVFEIKSPRNAIVRHRIGHATHFHVRFENPTAELTGRRAYRALRDARVLPNRRYYADRPAPRPNPLPRQTRLPAPS
jgi:murein endopeptidase